VKDEGDIDESVSLLKFLNTVHSDGIIGVVFFGQISNVDSVLYLSTQSDGFKPLTPSSEKGVGKFLDAALDASFKRQKKLLETLTLVAKTSTLSPKEIHVMVKVISGLTNKEIAEELDNSSRTIEIHRASIFEKLNVRNAIELSQLIHGVIRS
jgi:DNA-binding NarL/FixJ family response regulator